MTIAVICGVVWLTIVLSIVCAFFLEPAVTDDE